MENIVKVFINTKNSLPAGGSALAAAKDIRADISKIKVEGHNTNIVKVFVRDEATTGTRDYILYPTDLYPKPAVMINSLGRVLIPSGLHAATPVGTSIDLRPRSGLALKYGLTILNTPGTIDEDYRGDIGVILVNLGYKPVIVVDGERIGQLKLVKDIPWEWEEVDSVEDLGTTDRGEGGFGHTGTK